MKANSNSEPSSFSGTASGPTNGFASVPSVSASNSSSAVTIPSHAKELLLKLCEVDPAWTLRVGKHSPGHVFAVRAKQSQVICALPDGSIIGGEALWAMLQGQIDRLLDLEDLERELTEAEGREGNLLSDRLAGGFLQPNPESWCEVPMLHARPEYVIQTEIEWRSTTTQLDTPTKEGLVSLGDDGTDLGNRHQFVTDNALLAPKEKEEIATERREG